MGLTLETQKLILLLEKVIDMLQVFIDTELDLNNPDHIKIKKLVMTIHGTIDTILMIIKLFF